MLQLSVKMPIFAPSVEKDWRHRGEHVTMYFDKGTITK